ncbi:MAG: sulfotransferase [Luteolibacter sp.]
MARKAKIAGKPKIFCVGCNKTGTTSLKAALEELGFITGDQREAELMLEDWAKRDFSKITSYCHSAQAFQDVPFSLPETYKVMDQAFPGSRFILTIRDSSEQWYSSIVRFHGKIWGNGRTPPTREDLQEATYIYKGRPWQSNRLIFNTPEDDPYHRETLLEFYEDHNRSVEQYFSEREDDLLVINTAKGEDYGRLCRFLDVSPMRDAFPWENKT